MIGVSGGLDKFGLRGRPTPKEDLAKEPKAMSMVGVLAKVLKKSALTQRRED